MTAEQKIIKFLDLKAQYPLIKEEILQKFDDIIKNTSFVCGKNVKEFEEAFADYCGAKYCVTVNNGTSALLVSLLALGVGYGDEVIIPTNTFIATAEAVSLAGAKPVFVDIEEDGCLIDVKKIESNINQNTKAIIPVHIFGQCADMDAINNLAKRNNLMVIEDACQAHGSVYKKNKAGSMGDCAAFSFYPGKNLGAWGEGGAVTTNNEELADKIRLIRDHGSKQKYHHEIIGGNFRINEFQGAVLVTKLKYLDEWNKKRRENAKYYLELLKDIESIKSPVVCGENDPVWHLFVIRTKKREELLDYLKKEHVQVGMHYPFPLHLTEAYQSIGNEKGDFPVAEKVQDEILSLPMYAELELEEIEIVVEKIKDFFSQK